MLEEEDIESEESETQIYEMEDDNEQWDLVQIENDPNDFTGLLKSAQGKLQEQKNQINEFQDSISRLKGQEDQIDSQLIDLEQKFKAKENEIQGLSELQNSNNPDGHLVSKIKEYEENNDHLNKVLEIATIISKAKNDENQVHKLKILQLEDIFKSLENLLMTVVKEYDTIDLEMDEDYSIIENERQGHRECLVEMIQQIAELDKQEELVNNKIKQLEQRLN